MFALVSFFLILAFSFLVVRIGTVALTMTGLSEEVASFQALSAFSGAGFTTGEAESVVGTPVRRRIIKRLIELGNAGIITTISSLILSFVSAGEETGERLVILAGGVTALALLSRSSGFRRALTPVIRWGLRHTTSLDLRDYAGLLQFRNGYAVAELEVNPGDWLASARLGDLDLPAEGVVVLGIQRADGSYVGAPSSEVRLQPGDVLIAYGKAERLQELAVRNEQNQQAHLEAVEAHRREAAAEGGG